MVDHGVLGCSAMLSLLHPDWLPRVEGPSRTCRFNIATPPTMSLSPTSLLAREGQRLQSTPTPTILLHCPWWDKAILKAYKRALGVRKAAYVDRPCRDIRVLLSNVRGLTKSPQTKSQPSRCRNGVERASYPRCWMQMGLWYPLTFGPLPVPQHIQVPTSK